MMLSHRYTHRHNSTSTAVRVAMNANDGTTDGQIHQVHSNPNVREIHLKNPDIRVIVSVG